MTMNFYKFELSVNSRVCFAVFGGKNGYTNEYRHVLSAVEL